MSLVVMALIVVVVAAAAVGTMYLVRNRLRADTLMTDFDRTSGVFGFVGTAFAVLIAFVIFQAFDSYSTARGAAGAEAVAVQNEAHLAGLFSGKDRRPLLGDLDCYARAVVDFEWPAMRDRETSPAVENWIVRLRNSVQGIRVQTPARQAAFQELLAEDQARSEGRTVRVAEADPIVAAPLWFVLVVGGVLTIACALMFIDRRDSFVVEAILIASVAGLVAASLLIVDFLDHPYRGQAGSIVPSAMNTSLRVLEGENPGLTPPCSPIGAPRPSNSPA
jgi:hypothetical protein